MKAVSIFTVLCGLIGAKAPVSLADKENLLPLLMPSVQPKERDTYLCYESKLESGKPLYITGFRPQAKMAVAHHVLIYGCKEPGRSGGKPWNCGEMESTSKSAEAGPVCSTPGHIIYAWAMDAPELKLPDKVGFKVGGDSGINSLVLQVHYLDVTKFLPPTNAHDTSGVILTTTDVPQPKTAGVYLLGTGGSIPAHSVTYLETACSMNEPVVMHPFAYRVHAHTHGVVVSGYRIHDGEWTELGRTSPKKPQMFYPVTTKGVTVQKGDVLAARCTMKNDENADIKIGATSKDEMCNFYLMYYVDGDRLPKESYCFTDGSPTWDWTKFPGIDTSAIPDAASMLPDTGEIFRKTQQKFNRLSDELNKMSKNMNEMFSKAFDSKAGWLDSDDYGSNIPRYPPNYFPRRSMMDEFEPIEDIEPIEFDDDFFRQTGGEGYQERPYFRGTYDEPQYGFRNGFGRPVERLPRPGRPRFNQGPKANFPPEGEPVTKSSESFYNDKNGGKGYERSHSSYQKLNIPNGRGYIKSSRHESGYSYKSPAFGKRSAGLE